MLLASVGAHNESAARPCATFLVAPAIKENIRMEISRPLFIPVLLGTVRKRCQSRNAANLVLQELRGRTGVETELIDITKLPLPTDDAGEAIKDPGFSARMDRADALVIISPEYNHGYPGLLKHVLDSCLKEYIHKAAGIVGVSAGPFGGARVIEHLLPVLRELGLVTIFSDVNFSNVQHVFAADGKLLDDAYIRRIDKFLNELIWMATTLRHGREQPKGDSYRFR
jgi:NAD(P)H-dependent FMN reductase